MNKNILIAGAAILLIIGGVFISQKGASVNKNSAYSSLSALVYKTPTCGCCTVYSQYLKSEGVTTETKDLDDLTQIKEQYGIPQELLSCHTSVFGDYVVEGHIPLEVVDKLLTEKPDIKGIALPGMPSGSPGMPGPKVGEWTIYALHHDGTTSVYMKY
jgi:hypothetical protein